MIKKILVFLGIFFFMIIPKNVYALPSDSGVIEFYINNTNFVDSNSSLSYNSISYNLSTYINGTHLYNYYVIYFSAPAVSYDGTGRFGVSVAGGCTNNCFASNSYVKPIGVINGQSYYAIVLPLGKADCGVGTGQCVVSNNVFLYTIETMNITILGVDAMDTDTILDNNYAGFQSVINNQNSNTQNMITSFTTNIQNMINNSITQAQQQHQDMQQLNDSLTSEEAPTNNDVSDKVSNWNSKLAGTGPVSQMVLMPITLLNGYVTGFNATCSPYNLGDFMGTDLVLPCIDVSDYLGANLWGVIDVLFSGFMIFAIGKKFVKIFNDFTNLRDNQMDDLYGGGK